MSNTKDNIVKGSGDSGIKSLLIYVGTLYIVALFLAIAVVNRYIIDFGMADEKDYLSLMGALVVNGMFIIIVPILLKKRGLLYLKKCPLKCFYL